MKEFTFQALEDTDLGDEDPSLDGPPDSDFGEDERPELDDGFVYNDEY